MFKVSILVCDNGYGHLKRCLSIAYFLSSKGIMVDLYGDQKGFKMANDIHHKCKNKPNLIPWDFSYKVDYFLTKKCKNFDVVKKLPSLKKYDYVLSDNIIEVLFLRKDAILISQFFWHEVIKGVDKDYKSQCRKLLNINKPKIFGDRYFTMEYIKKNQNYLSTGIYSPNKKRVHFKKNLTKKKNLLITGGNTNQSFNILKNITNYMNSKSLSFVNKVYLDEKLLPDKPSSFMEKFNYQRSQFNDIMACICRPGLGIISDCIEHNIKLFTIFEENNLEMQHNAKIVNNIGIGEYLRSNNFLPIERYFDNYKIFVEENNLKCSSIKMDGCQNVYSFLMKDFTKNKKLKNLEI